MKKPLHSIVNGNYRAEVYGNFRNKSSYKLILTSTEEKRWFQRRKKKVIPLEYKLDRVPSIIKIQPNSKGFYLEIQYGLGNNVTQGPFSLSDS